MAFPEDGAMDGVSYHEKGTTVTDHPFRARGEWWTVCETCGLARAAHAATLAESEPLMEDMAKRAAEARRALLAAVDAEPDRWWLANELRDAAGVHGTIAMYALSRLCNPESDGTLELDNRLRIRRRAPSTHAEGGAHAHSDAT